MVLVEQIDLIMICCQYNINIWCQQQHISEHVGENGASSFSTPLWDPNNPNESFAIVLHNLGGCSMGKDRDHGVVDSLGRVYKGDGASLAEPYIIKRYFLV